MSDLYIKQICPVPVNQYSASLLSTIQSKKYVLDPFNDLTIQFLDAFSKSILTDKSINTFPEIVALGFWLRQTNIKKLVKENFTTDSSIPYKISPLGKVLHVCPANVDTMFVYSMAVSLLVGNKNVLRISNRMQAEHVRKIFLILNDLILQNKFSLFSEYINIISYEHSDHISNFLSMSVNARVIWGGDQTINIFKKFKTLPRTKDLVFSDRVSMLCINAKSYLQLSKEDVQKFASLFFNDAYTFDQMGCSSLQTIYFIGDLRICKECLLKFQSDLIQFLPKNYHSDLNSLASLKLNRMVDDLINNIVSNQQGNNYIKLLELNENINEALLHGCGGGYFYFRLLNSLDQIKSIQNVKVQTLAHWGFTHNELIQLQGQFNGEGLDRIVPMGEALNFHYIWDGYNLFDELSRKVYIKY
jgi:hypothetical protein